MTAQRAPLRPIWRPEALLPADTGLSAWRPGGGGKDVALSPWSAAIARVVAVPPACGARHRQAWDGIRMVSSSRGAASHAPALVTADRAPGPGLTCCLHQAAQPDTHLLRICRQDATAMAMFPWRVGHLRFVCPWPTAHGDRQAARQGRKALIPVWTAVQEPDLSTNTGGAFAAASGRHAVSRPRRSSLATKDAKMPDRSAMLAGARGCDASHRAHDISPHLTHVRILVRRQFFRGFSGFAVWADVPSSALRDVCRSAAGTLEEAAR